MKFFQQYGRLSRITYVWLKYGLDEIVLSIPWFKPVKFALWFNPLYWFRKKNVDYGERLRRALEELGPIFVKFGQLLSTRRDLLPDDIANALAELQDNVKPFPSAESEKLISEALGKPVREVFADFDREPLASASVAQVHTAKLRSGEEVVVKILRPGIERVIKHDLSLLYTLARLLERYWKDAKRLRLVELVKELERTLKNELDLMREAGNASQLRRNFKDSDLLYVPEVYWDYCRHNVMVMERIYGIPVTDIEALNDNEIDLKALAERGVEIFYTQVFRDCFFHADMHPGNIMVNPAKPFDPQYMGVDFGIMGTLSDEDKFYLAANFVAFFKRNYRRVAELHIQSGWVDADTKLEDFESALRSVCEPIFEKPLKDISFGVTLLRLFQIAREFNMTVQPQLMLLQKTLLNVEGLGRQLYPDLDLWSTAKPFLEKWMRQQLGPRGLIKRLRKTWPELSERLPQVPELIFKALKQYTDETPHPILLKAPETPRKRWWQKWKGFVAGIGIALIATSLLLWIPWSTLITVQQYFSQHIIAIGVVGFVLLIVSILKA